MLFSPNNFIKGPTKQNSLYCSPHLQTLNKS
jgi:hypothetical protein